MATPPIPPPTNGIEQRLDVLIAGTQELIDELKRWNKPKVDEKSAPERQVVDLREPVEPPKSGKKR